MILISLIFWHPGRRLSGGSDPGLGWAEDPPAAFIARFHERVVELAQRKGELVVNVLNEGGQPEQVDIDLTMKYLCVAEVVGGLYGFFCCKSSKS